MQTCDDGLTIALGRQGQPIRLTYADTRLHRPSDEVTLAEYALPLHPLMVNDKPANADRLIKQFIAEKTKKP